MLVVANVILFGNRSVPTITKFLLAFLFLHAKNSQLAECGSFLRLLHLYYLHLIVEVDRAYFGYQISQTRERIVRDCLNIEFRWIRGEVGLMEISNKTIGNAVIVSIEGSIAANETSNVKTYFDELLQITTVNGFILNCEKVTYIDSSGLNLVVSIFKAISEQSQRLILCAVNPRVMEVFLLTKLNKILTFTDTEESAIEQLS